MRKLKLIKSNYTKNKFIKNILFHKNGTFLKFKHFAKLHYAYLAYHAYNRNNGNIFLEFANLLKSCQNNALAQNKSSKVITFVKAELYSLYFNPKVVISVV